MTDMSTRKRTPPLKVDTPPLSPPGDSHLGDSHLSDSPLGDSPLSDSRNKEQSHDIAAVAARCFRGRDGDALLHHLHRMSIERRLPPNINESELRHVEGQRWLCSYIEALVTRGRSG